MYMRAWWKQSEVGPANSGGAGGPQCAGRSTHVRVTQRTTVCILGLTQEEGGAICFAHCTSSTGYVHIRHCKVEERAVG